MKRKLRLWEYRLRRFTAKAFVFRSINQWKEFRNLNRRIEI